MYSGCCTSRTAVKPHENATSRRLKAACAAQCHAEQTSSNGSSRCDTAGGLLVEVATHDETSQCERSFPPDDAGHLAAGRLCLLRLRSGGVSRDASALCCTAETYEGQARDRDRSMVSSPTSLERLLGAERRESSRHRARPERPSSPHHAATHAQPTRATHMARTAHTRSAGCLHPPTARAHSEQSQNPGDSSVRNESSRSGTLFRDRALGSPFFAGHWHVEMPTANQPWSAMTCLDGSRAPSSSSGDERRVS
jgi:hypothetical protein